VRDLRLYETEKESAAGRAFGKPKLLFHPRAHAQIQTDMQPELSDQKSIRAKHEILRANVSRETILNFIPLFVLLATSH